MIVARLTRLDRRRLRLVSGLILFAYLTTHLLNHVLGIHSLLLAEAGLRLAASVWHSVPGTALLYGAFTVHVSLALMALYEHRTLRMPRLELLRIALGLGMPTLLIGHAIATRLAFAVYGDEPTYSKIVWSLWHGGRQGWQLALLVPGWVHGCLGIEFAFSRSRRYLMLKRPLRAVAFALPFAAVAGFLVMGAELARLPEPPGGRAGSALVVAREQVRQLESIQIVALYMYGGLIASVFLARAVRRWRERHGRIVSVRYRDRTVQTPLGWSVLETSRRHGIAHRSVCGGRGRCSTCRVRVVDGRSHCPPPEDLERRTLVEFELGPEMRLACQLRPTGDVHVVTQP